MDEDLLLSLAAELDTSSSKQPQNEKPKPLPEQQPAPKQQPGCLLPFNDVPSIPSKQAAFSQQQRSSSVASERLIKAFHPRQPATQPTNQGFKDIGQGSFIQKHFGLKVKNPVVSSSQLESRLSDMSMIKLPHLKSRHFSCGLGSNWCTIAVLGEKSPPKQTANGRSYAIWKVTDLDKTSLPVFMFSGAYDDNYRESEGTLVAFLSPKIRAEGGDFALTADSSQHVLILGKAAEFGYCKATKKDGNPCRIPVNMHRCPYCVYHVGAEYNRMKPMRKELQGGTIHTAFNLSSTGNIKGGGGLQWAPGKFESAAPGAKRMQPLTSSQLKGTALLAANRGSAAGARYVRTVADPLAAKTAAADVELQKLRRNTLAPGAAPIPLPRSTNVVMEQRVPKRKKDRDADMIELDCDDDDRSAGNDDARRRAIEILKNRPKKSSAPVKVPKFLAEAVELQKRQQQQQQQPQQAGVGISTKEDDGVIGLDMGSLRGSSSGRRSASQPATSAGAAAGALGGRSLASIRPNPTALVSTITTTRRTGVGSSKGAATASKPAPSAFAQAFGSVVREMEATIGGDGNRGSLYAAAVDAEDDHRLDITLTALEQKDELATKMDSVKFLETQAWKCEICKYTSEHRGPECSRTHPYALKKVSAIKRWWQCGGCSKRFTTLGQRYPIGRCPKCDVAGTDFKAVSMFRAPREYGPEEQAFASRDKMLARGVEQKWVNQ